MPLTTEQMREYQRKRRITARHADHQMWTADCVECAKAIPPDEELFPTETRLGEHLSEERKALIRVGASLSWDEVLRRLNSAQSMTLLDKFPKTASRR